MNIRGIVRSTEKLVSENSPAILTAIGVTGTLTTAFLTGKASFKAAEIIRKEEMLGGTAGDSSTRTKERAKLVWREYIPAAASGAATVTAIVMANRIGTRRTAAMAAGMALTERAFDEYSEKVKEKLGEKKEREFRSEIAQDQVSRSFDKSEHVVVNQGEQLCHDAYTGRYFSSSVEKLRRAENNVNKQIINNDYASLTTFYNNVGLEPTVVSDDVGWNHDGYCELLIDSTLTKDNVPAISFDFAQRPQPHFDRFR